MSGREFRPVLGDVLEDRVVLSRGGVVAKLAEAAVHARATQHVAAKAFGPVATLGDSYTDEYSTYPGGRSTARNWVQFLANNRTVDFGTYSNVSWGESRYQGYGNNYARSDAKSQDLINYQLPELLPRVQSGQVTNVVVLIGGNDLLKPLYSIQSGALTPEEVGGLLPQITDRLIANVDTAVTAILRATPRARVVVGTINVGVLPAVQEALRQNPGLQPLVDGLNQASDAYNSSLYDLAARNPGRVAVVDIAGPFQQVGNLVAGGTTEVPYGGTVLRLNTVGDDLHNLFLGDGIHLGTIGQGQIANQILTTFNTAFGARFRLLTPNEIVKFATSRQYNGQIHGVKLPKPPIPPSPPGSNFSPI